VGRTLLSAVFDLRFYILSFRTEHLAYRLDGTATEMQPKRRRTRVSAPHQQCKKSGRPVASPIMLLGWERELLLRLLVDLYAIAKVQIFHGENYHAG
jgi:hypothetical protein